MSWLLFLFLLLPEAGRLLAAQSGAKLDQREQAHAIVLAHQPGDADAADAWPLVWEACTEYQAVADEIRKIPAPSADDTLYLDFSILLPHENVEDAALQAALREQAARALDHLRLRGAFEKLSRAAAAPRAVVPLPSDGIQAPILGGAQMLALARANRVRMFQASQRGDWPEFADAAIASRTLARVSAQQCSIIRRLVADSIDANVLEDIRFGLMESQIPPLTCRALLDSIQTGPPWPDDLAATVAFERLVSTDFTQCCFTDNGRGDGLPIVSVVAYTLPPYLLGDDFPGIARMVFDLPGANLLGLMLATKARTRAVLDQYFDGLARLAAADARGRTPDLFDPAGLIRSLGWRHWATRQFLQLYAGAHVMWLETEDQHRLYLVGTRLILALELYHAAHGDYPAELAGLVPGFLPDAPADPLSGFPLRYRLLDPRTDPHDRGYLLYSVGFDRIDNDGVTRDTDPAAALRSNARGRGFDFVLNAPRPQAVP